MLRAGDPLSTTAGAFPNPKALTLPTGTACLVLDKGGSKDQQVRSLWSGPCLSLQQREARPDLHGPAVAPLQQLTLRPKALNLHCVFSWQVDLGDGGCALRDTSTRSREALLTDQGGFELQLPSAQVLPHLGQATCATVRTVDPPGDQ